MVSSKSRLSPGYHPTQDTEEVPKNFALLTIALACCEHMQARARSNYDSHVSIQASADRVPNLEANLRLSRCVPSCISRLFIAIIPHNWRVRAVSIADLHGTALRFIAYPHELSPGSRSSIVGLHSSGIDTLNIPSPPRPPPPDKTYFDEPRLETQAMRSAVYSR